MTRASEPGVMAFLGHFLRHFPQRRHSEDCTVAGLPAMAPVGQAFSQSPQLTLLFLVKTWHLSLFAVVAILPTPNPL